MQELTYNADQVQKFLEEKGVRLDCECCGKDEWELLDKVGGANFSSANLNEWDTRTFVIPSFVLLCENCGNIRQFARENLAPKE